MFLHSLLHIVVLENLRNELNVSHFFTEMETFLSRNLALQCFLLCRVNINIPTKLFKQYSSYYGDIITILSNNMILTNCFPNNLKLGDIIPAYKKDDSNMINNYRPISILPVISKIFERILAKQINDYIY